LLNSDLIGSNNFEYYDSKIIFTTQQFTLNQAESEINLSDVYSSKIIFTTQQFTLNQAESEINLSDVHSSSVIFSGAGFRYLIQTGITGAT
jgi:hypothetical protein